MLASACQNGLSSFVQSQFDYYASGQPLRPSQLTEIFRQAVKPGPISRKVYADSVASIIKYGESSDYDMEQAFFSVFEEVVRKIRAYMSTKRDGVVELVKLMASYGYPIEKDRVERHFPRHVIELMILQVWPSQAEAPAGRARVPAREQTRPMALRYVSALGWNRIKGSCMRQRYPSCVAM